MFRTYFLQKKSYSSKHSDFVSACVFSKTAAWKILDMNKELYGTCLLSVFRVRIPLDPDELCVGFGHMQPFERLVTMFLPPVFLYIPETLGNTGAASATEARPDAAFVLEVALQVALSHVGLVATLSWTFPLTPGHLGILGVRGNRLEVVRFPATSLGLIRSFKCLRQLLFFYNKCGLRGRIHVYDWISSHFFYGCKKYWKIKKNII